MKSEMGSTMHPQIGGDKNKMIQYLQKALKEQIQKRIEAETKLKEYCHRSLVVKNEFTRMIQKYDQNLAVLNGQPSYTQQIWTKMMSTVEDFNRREEIILQERCKEIQEVMTRKLNQVYLKMDQQLFKSKQLSFEQLLTIKEDIKEAVSLSQFIYEENIKYKGLTKELVFKNKVLNQEKNLLIEEINNQKMTFRKMISSNSIKESRTHSFSKNSYCLSSGDSSIQPNNRTTKKVINMEMKTIDHLKSCFERQKKRKNQLSNIVSELQFKISEITSILNNVDEIKRQQNIQIKCSKLQSLLDVIKIKMYVSNQKRKQSHSTLSNFDLLSYS